MFVNVCSKRLHLLFNALNYLSVCQQKFKQKSGSENKKKTYRKTLVNELLSLKELFFT